MIVLNLKLILLGRFWQIVWRACFGKTSNSKRVSREWRSKKTQFVMDSAFYDFLLYNEAMVSSFEEHFTIKIKPYKAFNKGMTFLKFNVFYIFVK